MKIQLTKEEAEKILLEAVRSKYSDAFRVGSDLAYNAPFTITWNGHFIGDDDGLLSFELAQSPD